MPEKRPDPDLLLKQVLKEEERARQGKLKIFFGAVPGVGKTYAMLEARQKPPEGIDIVEGLVETHKRKEIEELLHGFEVIPRRSVEYHGATFASRSRLRCSSRLRSPTSFPSCFTYDIIKINKGVC